MRASTLFTQAALLGLLLTSNDSSASRFFGPETSSKSVSTLFGDFPQHTVDMFCRAPRVVVAKVVAVDGILLNSAGAPAPTIMSHAILEVEQVLRYPDITPVETSLHLVLAGGKSGGQTVAPPSGMMVPGVGLRYILAYLPAVEHPGGLVQPGDPLVGAHAYLDPGMDLETAGVQDASNFFEWSRCQ